MKTKKKNRFLTFCFSCIPGAGEMYLGFMRKGVSTMLLFVLTISVAILINQGVLATICIVEWFYSFFYTNNLASLNDEEFAQMKDGYLFGMDALPGAKEFVRKNNKWVAYILIFVGICFLCNSLTSLLSWLLPDQLDFIWKGLNSFSNYLPSILLSFGIIILGIKLLGGKVEIVAQEPLLQDEASQEDAGGKDL